MYGATRRSLYPRYGRLDPSVCGGTAAHAPAAAALARCGNHDVLPAGISGRVGPILPDAWPVHEVVITDDCNGTDVDALLPRQSVPSLGHNLLKRKLRLVRNPTRLYVFRNKVASVAAVASEWVAVVDSDSVMGDSYFDTLARHWSTVYDNSPTRTIYSPATWAPHPLAPSSAPPTARRCTSTPTPSPRACSSEAVLLNAGNQIVHRRTALAAWRNVASSAYGHEAGKEGHESVLLNALMLSAGARLE